MSETYGELRKSGITHVLNCVDRIFNNKIYKRRGMTYLSIQTFDLESFDISAYFKTAADFIHTALEGEGKLFSFIDLSNIAKAFL